MFCIVKIKITIVTLITNLATLKPDTHSSVETRFFTYTPDIPICHCMYEVKNYILHEIPKARFMDFGLLYENDKGEYVVLNDVRMADIRLASLVYLPCLR